MTGPKGESTGEHARMEKKMTDSIDQPDLRAKLDEQYDVAIATLLRNDKPRRTRPRLTFAQLGDLKEKAATHLDALAAAGIEVAGIDASYGDVRLHLPDAILVQDAESGDMQMRGYEYHRNHKSYVNPGERTRGTRRIRPVRTPDDLVSAYAEIATEGRFIAAAYGSKIEDEETKGNPLAVHAALAREMEEIDSIKRDPRHRETLGALILGLTIRGVDILQVQPGDKPGTIRIITPDASFVQKDDGTMRAYSRIDGDPHEWVGEPTHDVETMIKTYFDEVLPSIEVEKALRASREKERREAADRRRTRDADIVAAYEALPVEMREGFRTMIAYIALGERRSGSWDERGHHDGPHMHFMGGPFGGPFGHMKHMPPIATMLLHKLDMLEKEEKPAAGKVVVE